MKRTPVSFIPGLPDNLLPFARGQQLYDSSCSPQARVWFSGKDGGLYIKTAPKGTLKTEADMNAFFYSRRLGPQVLAYETYDADWMVTRAVPGEDCLYPQYPENPKRLSALLGELLRQLHGTDPTGCPVTDCSESFLASVTGNRAAGIAEPAFWKYGTAEEAWQVVQKNRDILDSRVLLHGDYCLPNIVLQDWRFSGFIDVGHGGIGDRHLDLYWGAWSILFNLKEERWCSRFLDAYGRDLADAEKLRIIGAFQVFG